jgi:hypothetical protein
MAFYSWNNIWSLSPTIPSEGVTEAAGTPSLGYLGALSSLHTSWCAVIGIPPRGVSNNTLWKAPAHWLLPRNGIVPGPCSFWVAMLRTPGQPFKLGWSFSILPSQQRAPLCSYLPSKNDNCLSSMSMTYDEAKQDCSAQRKHELEVLEWHKYWRETGKLLLSNINTCCDL